MKKEIMDRNASVSMKTSTPLMTLIVFGIMGLLYAAIMGPYFGKRFIVCVVIVSIGFIALAVYIVNKYYKVPYLKLDFMEPTNAQVNEILAIYSELSGVYFKTNRLFGDVLNSTIEKHDFKSFIARISEKDFLIAPVSYVRKFVRIEADKYGSKDYDVIVVADKYGNTNEVLVAREMAEKIDQSRKLYLIRMNDGRCHFNNMDLYYSLSENVDSEYEYDFSKFNDMKF